MSNKSSNIVQNTSKINDRRLKQHIFGDLWGIFSKFWCILGQKIEKNGPEVDWINGCNDFGTISGSILRKFW